MSDNHWKIAQKSLQPKDKGALIWWAVLIVLLIVLAIFVWPWLGISRQANLAISVIVVIMGILGAIFSQKYAKHNHEPLKVVHHKREYIWYMLGPLIAIAFLVLQGCWTKYNWPSWGFYIIGGIGTVLGGGALCVHWYRLLKKRWHE